MAMKSDFYSASTIAVLLLTGCNQLGDPNAEATYGESGLPANCRAYVQSVIDAHRQAASKNDMRAMKDAIDGLERNCGRNGHSWGKQPK